MPEQTNEEIDLEAEFDAAMEKVEAETENPDMKTSAREAAALEERLAAERVAQARANGEEAAAMKEPEPDPEPLITMAAKGREYLLEQMRLHQNKPKKEYVPPPMTDKMRANIEEEMEAGRRTQQRHQEQWDNRPQPKPDPREGGPSTPVHRPGNVVPDPKLPAGPFAAGTKVFSPDA